MHVAIESVEGTGWTWKLNGCLGKHSGQDERCLTKLPRSVKGQSLDFENSIGMTTIVMERVHGASTGVRTGDV